MNKRTDKSEYETSFVFSSGEILFEYTSIRISRTNDSLMFITFCLLDDVTVTLDDTGSEKRVSFQFATIYF